MQDQKSKMDVLEEASLMLSEPSRNTKRRILTGFNYVFIFAIALHFVIQLVEFGTLPDPARDLVLFPIFIVINTISAIYNTRVLWGIAKPTNWMSKFTAWSTIGFSLILSLLIVHQSINTATSLLIDFGLSVIMIFIVGTVIGRNAAIGWFIIASISLFVAYQNVGEKFEYHLLTNQEVQEFKESLAQGDPEAVERMEQLTEEKLKPIPIGLFVGVWFVYMITLFVAVFYESNMISKVLSVIPAVIDKISIASREKNKLQNENMRMGLELDVARRIQMTLLPKVEEFSQIEHLEIAARMDPATEVGGDFYEILPQEDGSVILAIGDVTDHGLQSGLVMLMVQSTIRTILDTGNKSVPLSSAMNHINTVMYRNIRNRMNDIRNLTMCLARIYENQVTICGQHENVLKFNHHSREVEVISTEDLGIYVGLIENIEDHVNEMQIDFSANDILLLYTDGLTEAENAEGEFFGEERLKTLFDQHHTMNVKQMVDNIFYNIYQFTGSQKILDDISLMIVRRTSK